MWAYLNVQFMKSSKTIKERRKAMYYGEVKEAIFKERPNRFIAYCEVGGVLEKVHVKNTGRCKELLVPGTKVYLQVHDNPNRKTKYSLITVQKGNRLVNIDSQAPNTVVEEALKEGRLKLPSLEEPLINIKREKTYGNSRFDFYMQAQNKEAFMEIKGATLEQEDYVMFPDAKTERGTKHVEELIKAVEAGYNAYVLFVIQMENVRYFTPHVERDPKFAQALYEASQKGVKILAYECKVTKNTLSLTREVPVRIPSFKTI